jgi:2-furoate---CoA ligase
MLDLGTSFLASVARDPNALALVDRDVRLSYAEWLNRISSLVAAFDRIGLKPGDHLLTALQNTWQAATVHWACQLAGLIITPVNWRVTADELDFCIENSGSRAVIYQDVSEGAVAASARTQDLFMMRAGTGQTSAQIACTRALARKHGPSCSTRPERRHARKVCRVVIARSGQRELPMLHRISIAAASERSA